MTTEREIPRRIRLSGQVGSGRMRGQKDGPGGACDANPVLDPPAASRPEGGPVVDIMPPEPDDKPTPRRAISRRLRYEILRRDNSTCRYCHATDTPLTIDHLVPVALGGTDDPSNLVAACKDCNAGKSSSSPDAAMVAQVDEDAIRWSAAIKQAAAEMSEADTAGADYCQPIANAWDDDNQVYRWSRARLPHDWTETVERWRKAGLPSEMVVEAIGIAMRNKQVYDVWRYTAGICWTRTKELQERAAEIVAGPR